MIYENTQEEISQGYEIARAYTDGIIQAWPGMEVAQQHIQQLGYDQKPFFIANASRFYTGQKRMLYDITRKVLGSDTKNYPQQIGDCFIAGTKVLMADGSEKSIEDVKVGDSVVTTKNRPRQVLNTIKKPYTGPLVVLRAKGHPESVTATPDHRFVNVPFKHHRYEHHKADWKRIGDFSHGDKLLIPFGLSTDEPPESLVVYEGKPSSFQPPRQTIRFDENAGRLFGIYLAEGGASSNEHGPYLVEFSLSYEETDLANEVVSLMGKVFGVDAHIDRLPSKPSVILVRCGNVDVARFIKKLIPGNVYDKRVPAVAFRSSREVRLALLHGWMDGDGCDKAPGKRVGVSCCHGLVSDMHRLCRSLGLRPMWNRRKKYAHQRVASGQLCLYGVNSGDRPVRRMRDLGLDGRAVSVKDFVYEYASGINVHCLEIEEDHSFIANGYGVSNCVSFGAKNGTEYVTCTEILLGKREKFRPIFPPYFYGSSRCLVGGQHDYSDGSSGTWMAEAVQKYGAIFADEPGVPTYSGNVAKKWGHDGPPDQWITFGKQHIIRSAALIRSWDDLVAAIVNGYPCPTASNVGYQMEASSDGFHRRGPKWSHQMCFIGVGFAPEEYAIILNNWGDVHGRLTDFDDKTTPLPVGVLRVRRRDAEAHIHAGETFAYSQFDGFPEQPIDEAMFKVLGS